MSRQKAVSLLLQLALSLYFAYVGVSALLNPDIWVAFLPSFLRGHSFSLVLLKLWSVGLLGLGVWVISGKRIFIPTLIATILLTITTLINIGSFEYFFHDLSLVAAAFSLCIIHIPRTKEPNERRRPA